MKKTGQYLVFMSMKQSGWICHKFLLLETSTASTVPKYRSTNVCTSSYIRHHTV